MRGFARHFRLCADTSYHNRSNRTYRTDNLPTCRHRDYTASQTANRQFWSQEPQPPHISSRAWQKGSNRISILLATCCRDRSLPTVIHIANGLNNLGASVSAGRGRGRPNAWTWAVYIYQYHMTCHNTTSWSISRELVTA